MNNVAAKIYVICAVITILLFLITRRVYIRVIKSDVTVVSIGFILFKLELTKKQNSKQEKPVDTDTKSEIPLEFNEVFSLLAMLMRYFKKCTITIRRLTVPYKTKEDNIYSPIGFRAALSALLVYIDSSVEKLIVTDNAFILSSDTKPQFDITLGILLFDLIVLAIRLIIKGLKIERLEKADVGN